MATESRELTVMRHMAWERAKGELKSMLRTFYPEYDGQGGQVESNFAPLDKAVEKFIKTVEENGWYE